MQIIISFLIQLHLISGLADPKALTIALSALDAVQLVGMPESDCIVAQVAVYLARAPKSQEVHLNCSLNSQNVPYLTRS